MTVKVAGALQLTVAAAEEHITITSTSLEAPDGVHATLTWVHRGGFYVEGWDLHVDLDNQGATPLEVDWLGWVVREVAEAAGTPISIGEGSPS